MRPADSNNSTNGRRDASRTALATAYLRAAHQLLEAKLRAGGFTEVLFLAPEEAEARYFRDRPRDLPAPARTHIVAALR